jgi:hypothetical protein
MRRWHKKICRACNHQFRTKQHNREYCNKHRRAPSVPSVYRFVCPDGRSYVGSVSDGLIRDREGVGRRNGLLDEAFEKYPPDTWIFEVLEWLPLDSDKIERRIAEQKWINHFDSMNPERGFNIRPPYRGMLVIDALTVSE